MRELHFDVTGQLLRRNKQCDFENIVLLNAIKMVL